MWQEINYTEDLNDLLVPNITYKINPAEIDSIEANSIAEEIGFESGDSIISINGKKPRDLIDYQILISCLLYTSPSPRDISGSRMPSSA